MQTIYFIIATTGLVLAAFVLVSKNYHDYLELRADYDKLLDEAAKTAGMLEKLRRQTDGMILISPEEFEQIKKEIYHAGSSMGWHNGVLNYKKTVVKRLREDGADREADMIEAEKEIQKKVDEAYEKGRMDGIEQSIESLGVTSRLLENND